MDVLPIVDTHQHLWDLSRFELPWVSGAAHLNRSFLPADYAVATAGLPIAATVYMEVDMAPAQHVAEAEYVVELCRDPSNPMQAAVVSGRPDSTGFGAYLDRIQAPEIRGLRQVLHGSAPPGHCLRPEFVEGIRELGRRGMSFDLCLRDGELSDGAALIDRCPETRFILDHCGNAFVPAFLAGTTADSERVAKWEGGLRQVAQRPNVVCKVSGIVVSALSEWQPADLWPAIERVLEAFGPDRVMFGGDWPVCTRVATFQTWTQALIQVTASLSREEREKLFFRNAVGHYGLASIEPIGG